MDGRNPADRSLVWDSHMTPDPPRQDPMKPNALLTVTSLLSILLMSLHVTDDIVRGISPPGADNVGAVVIFVVWLFGTLALSERRSGFVIMLLGGLAAAAVPVLHMKGHRYAAIATSSGGFFFVWTLIVLGVTGTFSGLLSARALWVSFRRRQAASGSPAIGADASVVGGKGAA